MEQKYGTPKTLDQMFEQLQLDELTESRIRKALQDYLGNKFNVCMFGENSTREDIVLEIYQKVMNQ